MPPIIALFIWSIFAAFLLYLDRKQSPDVSVFSWIPSIWFLLIAGKPLAVWFGVGSESMEEGSALDRAFITLLIIVGLIVLFFRQFSWTSAIRNNKSVILFVLFSVVSISWSDMAYISLKRFVREALAPFIMAMVVLSEKNPQHAAESIFRRAVYVLIPLSYILIHYYPGLGRQYGRWFGDLTWIGASLQKNGLAALCSFSILYLMFSLVRRKRSKKALTGSKYVSILEIFILALAFWMFLGPHHSLTYSVTSAVALSVALLAMTVMYKFNRNRILRWSNKLAVFIAAVIIFGTLTPFAQGLFIGDIAPNLGRSESLTGRTEIWAYLTPLAEKQLVLGHGFGGFWTHALREASSSHAHNGYLDIILNIGLGGLVVFSIFFLSSCAKIAGVMREEFEFGCFWFCLLLMVLTHNIAESTVTTFEGLMAAALLFLFVSFTPSKVQELRKAA